MTRRLLARRLLPAADSGKLEKLGCLLVLSQRTSTTRPTRSTVGLSPVGLVGLV